MLKGTISYPFLMSAVSKDLIGSLLQCDVSRRLTTSDAIKRHAFFGELNWSHVAMKLIVPPYVPTVREETPGDAHYFDVVNTFEDHAAKMVGSGGGGSKKQVAAKDSRTEEFLNF